MKAKRITLGAVQGIGNRRLVLPYPPFPEIGDTITEAKTKVDWRVTAIEDTDAYIFPRPPAQQAAAEIRCSECNRREGNQHRPGCHRQGVVTDASDYRRQGIVTEADCNAQIRCFYCGPLKGSQHSPDCPCRPVLTKANRPKEPNA